ncbi:hypothetical protein NM688_g4615 [Phlebia brevispora]|uniref:Uncharacterized protein n=1 Tax=Phlebia brevispora TaxID=194682 RepID=A0ACC1T2J9_9APHY|nr:hypothetical protein NM688_g4615 [Phlebia brevispora]
MDPIEITSTVLSIVNYLRAACQQVKENKEECERLSQHAREVIEIVQSHCTSGIPHNVARILERLGKTLQEITDTITQISMRSYLQKVLWRGKISGRISQAYKDIERTLTALNASNALLHFKHEAAREADATQVEQNFERILTMEQDILQALEVQKKEWQQAILAIQMHIGSPNMTDPVERKLLENGMHELQRRSGPMGTIPDEFTITSLDIIILYDRIVGTGGYARVYQGDWKGELVAVKVMEQTSQLVLQKEVNVWKRLRHPRILQFFGASAADASPPFIVCALLANGDSISYLLRNPDANRCQILHDAAVGLSYLHRNNVIHGDLKGTNILIDEHGHACLSDFGISNMKAHSTSSTMRTVQLAPGQSAFPEAHTEGTLRWMSPESLLYGTKNKKTDIYSFGITMFEIFTGLPPFANLPDQRMIQQVCDGWRPERPADPQISIWGLNNQVWALMEKCWAHSPRSRCYTSEVCEVLAQARERQSVPSRVEMRLWNPKLRNPELHDTCDIFFEFPSASSPRVLLGIAYFDFENHKDTRAAAEVTGVTGTGMALSHRQGGAGQSQLWGIGFNWLKIPVADEDIQCGRFDTIHDLDEDSELTRTAKQIIFNPEYSEPPKVVAWMDGIRNYPGNHSRLRIQVQDITEDGCTIIVETWGGSKTGGGITWLAHSSSRTDMTSGSYSTLDVRPSSPQLKTTGHVSFEGSHFSEAPIMYTAIRGFDIGNESWNVRYLPGYSQVTPDGFDWSIGAWSSESDATQFYSGDMSFVAFRQQPRDSVQ